MPEDKAIVLYCSIVLIDCSGLFTIVIKNVVIIIISSNSISGSSSLMVVAVIQYIWS